MEKESHPLKRRELVFETAQVSPLSLEKLMAKYEKTDEFYEGRRIGLRVGYPVVSWQDHPIASPGAAWVYVHRLEWYKHFGVIPKDFHVHHKDRNRLNWSIENLELLHKTEHAKHHAEERFGVCPPNPACSSCGTIFKRRPSQRYGKRQFCSVKCRLDYPQQKKIVWPKTEALLEMIAQSSFLAVGKQLGVSDNAIRKHLKKRAALI